MPECLRPIVLGACVTYSGVNMFRVLQVLLVSLFLTAQAWAGGADEVAKFADNVAGTTLKTITDASLSSAAKQGKLEALFRDNVDIPWVGRFVLGKHWRTATPDQQKKYISNYETFLIKTYTSRFTKYSGQSYKITGTREESTPGEYLLSMQVVQQNGQPPVLLDYKVRRVGTGYKIFDIVVEGVSLLTTQRAEFNSVVNSKGLDFLIDTLGKRATSIASAAK